MPTITDSTVVASTYDMSGNGGRRLAREKNGSLVALVKDTTSASTKGWALYRSDNNGTSFYKAVDNFVRSTFNDSCVVYSPYSDKFYVIEAYSNTTVAVFMRNNDTTISAGNFVNVDTGQTTLGNCSLAIDSTGTTLHAAWASKNATYANSFNIRYASGTINADGSVSWGAVQQVTTYNTTGSDTTNPSIVIANGTPVILSQYYDGSVYYILFRRFTTSWTGSSVYFTSTYTQSNPSAVFVPQSINGLTNGRIWVVWHGMDSTDTAKNNIRLSYSDDGGVTWSAMTKLTSGNVNDMYYPSISATKTNDVWIVHTSSSASNGVNYLKLPSGGSWSATTNLKSGTATTYPSALYDTTLAFASPLFIYKDTAKVGFYGTWTVTTISVTQGPIGTKSDKTNLLTYTITTDGTMGTITEAVNGTTVNTKNIASGTSTPVGLTQTQWDAIKYGKYQNATGGLNTLTVSMGTDTWTYTFDKRLATTDDIAHATQAVSDTQTTHLPSVKKNIASAIRGKGGTVNDTDSFDTMVSAIANASNKRWASGSGTSDSSAYVTVTGLSFKPSIIIIYPSNTNYFTVYSTYRNPNSYDLINMTSASSTVALDGTTKYVNATSFKLQTLTSVAVNWYAIE